MHMTDSEEAVIISDKDGRAGRGHRSCSDKLWYHYLTIPLDKTRNIWIGYISTLSHISYHHLHQPHLAPVMSDSHRKRHSVQQALPFNQKNALSQPMYGKRKRHQLEEGSESPVNSNGRKLRYQERCVSDDDVKVHHINLGTLNAQFLNFNAIFDFLQKDPSLHISRQGLLQVLSKVGNYDDTIQSDQGFPDDGNEDISEQELCAANYVLREVLKRR